MLKEKKLVRKFIIIYKIKFIVIVYLVIVNVKVKSRGCQQIGFGSLIIDYICNFLISSLHTERIFKNQVFTLYVIKAQCRDCYRLKPVFLWWEAWQILVIQRPSLILLYFYQTSNKQVILKLPIDAGTGFGNISLMEGLVCAAAEGLLRPPNPPPRLETLSAIPPRLPETFEVLPVTPKWLTEAFEVIPTRLPETFTIFPVIPIRLPETFDILPGVGMPGSSSCGAVTPNPGREKIGGWIGRVEMTGVLCGRWSGVNWMRAPAVG